MTTFTASTATDSFVLRDSLVDYLRGAVAATPGDFPAGTKVYSEQPDALVPPAYAVLWEGTTPAADQWGVWTTELAVECWPATDLTDSAHVASRDQLLAGALGAVAGLWMPVMAAVATFTSALETRQLGQQVARIAVVRVFVQHAAPCP